jgi:hypothetical protein
MYWWNRHVSTNVLVELRFFYQYSAGTDMFPPIAMKMRTGSNNKHISQIFFVLAAPVWWWEMVSCTNTNSALAEGSVMLAKLLQVFANMKLPEISKLSIFAKI